MSLEELRTLVTDKETELEAMRKSRNKAQVEHASIQKFYDVGREQNLELDMKVDKIDLDIENAEEDNATELKVYKQKSKFIQYCHDAKKKAITEEGDLKQQNYNTCQESQISELEVTKSDMINKLKEIETRQSDEIKHLQAEIDDELVNTRRTIDLDISRFQDECDQHHAQLELELEHKREAELEMIKSRQESHLQDLMQTHKTTCEEMKEYFDGIEREQEIEIEELQMEIRRLKKAAIQHAETKDRLESSNAENGKELDICTQQV